jgi:hypothetical protein
MSPGVWAFKPMSACPSLLFILIFSGGVIHPFFFKKKTNKTSFVQANNMLSVYPDLSHHLSDQKINVEYFSPKNVF